MHPKNPLQLLFLFLKGVAMGAADVVPGVSGGTIAFISGIYEELIETIHRLNFSFFKVWKRNGFRIAWRNYNLTFLLLLFSGVLLSIVSLAKLIGWLLKNEPILVWSFFFGLIIASIVYIGKMIRPWNITIGGILVLATIGSYLITLGEPMASPDNNWFIFFSGFVAIIAMILPGISGSFILLLLGSYTTVIGTINDLSSSISTFNWYQFSTAALKLLSFALGAVLGLKVFSGVLNWLFKHYKNSTFAVLTGFMIGALNKIWPWKEVTKWRTNSAGEQVALLEKSILPDAYSGEPQVLLAVIFAVFGFLIIFSLERLASKKGQKV